MDTIALGKHNPRLADIRRAIHRGVLTGEGLLPVEGPKLLGEALSSGLACAAVFLRQDAPAPELPGSIPTYRLSPEVFRGIQSTGTSQGVIGLIHPRHFDLAEILRSPRGPIVVLGGLQDPGNAGTILRIAESFGSAGCLGLNDTAGLYNPKTLRASAGSVFRLPHVWNLDLAHAAGELRRAGIRLAGTSPHAGSTIAGWDWRQPVAVLFGNEGSGLTEEQIDCCDAMLRIPHMPQVESLNSAVAAAIVLYEAYRQRGAP